jgi:uncharacterized protein (TIGR00251 family)
VIEVSSHPEGATLRVRAQPGAKKDALLGERAGALRVAVTAAPERGKANEAIVELLARSLGVRRAEITLLSGETSRDKRFLIHGIATADLVTRLSAASPHQP